MKSMATKLTYEKVQQLKKPKLPEINLITTTIPIRHCPFKYLVWDKHENLCIYHPAINAMDRLKRLIILKFELLIHIHSVEKKYNFDEEISSLQVDGVDDEFIFVRFNVFHKIFKYFILSLSIFTSEEVTGMTPLTNGYYDFLFNGITINHLNRRIIKNKQKFITMETIIE